MVTRSLTSVDTPGAVNVQFQKWLQLPYAEFQLLLNSLYSAYSLPNMVLPLVGGLLIDQFDSTYILIAFTLIVCVGQSIFVYGVDKKISWAMLVGRIIFGVGAETLEVGQADILNNWFDSHHLSTAYGLTISFQRLVTTLMFNISPVLAETVSTPFAFEVGLWVCLAGLIASIILVYLNRFAPPSIDTGSEVPLFDERSRNSIDSRSSCSMDGRSDSHSINSTEIAIQDEDTRSMVSNRRQSFGSSTSQESTIINQMSFTRSFYYLVIITILTYGSFAPFIHVGAELMQRKWFPTDPQQVGLG